MPIRALTPTPSEPATTHDLDWVVGADLEGVARVIIHNDDVTPYDFVIVILKTVFGLGPSDAERVTANAHFNGQAYVLSLPLEEAKYRVGHAHSLARQAGYPLRFTIEPEKQ